MSKSIDWTAVNDRLRSSSYIGGYTPTALDFETFDNFSRSSLVARAEQLAALPHLSRWYSHISSFSQSERNCICGSESIRMPPVTEHGRRTSERLSTTTTAGNNEQALTPESLLHLLDALRLDSDQHQPIAVDSLQLAAKYDCDHQKIVGLIKSVQSLGDLVTTEQYSCKRLELTSEGTQVANDGSHEAVLFNKVPLDGGILQAELMKSFANAKIGFSKAISSGWIELDKKAPGGPTVRRKVSSIEDHVQKQLQQIRDNPEIVSLPDSVKNDFKKRKLLTEVTIKAFKISPAAGFTTTISKPETDLTAEMVASGSWRTCRFKEYNFDALGVPPSSGHLHPLLKVRAEFRQIFLEMGFSEMPTNNFVESSFWNFDALFQPQQHPARDAHDTFFISDPSTAKDIPEDYMQRVKTVHSTGGYGSQGYQYDWSVEEAKKNLLRTHTTAVSARMLYKLAQQDQFKPVKYFSIDRVFRNETLDATHLAEFHQVEGVMADRDLTLGHLIGVLHEFFNRLGIYQLRFKPAYNPYTEPSMEIFSYHEGLKKWVEIGNSGVFRPEMLLPMGLPEDVNVIAWGLSLERPTMIRYGIENIRDLIGPRVNLKMVYDNPICRLDKQ